jgi:hypothetical protein
MFRLGDVHEILTFSIPRGFPDRESQYFMDVPYLLFLLLLLFLSFRPLRLRSGQAPGEILLFSTVGQPRFVPGPDLDL